MTVWPFRNGTMYKLKPVFGVPLEVKNTCSMYKLKNLHEKTLNAFGKTDQAKQKAKESQSKENKRELNNEIQSSDQDIQELLKKQSLVLSQLVQLELRLSQLDVPAPITNNSIPVQVKKPNLSTTCKIVKNSESEIKSDLKSLIKTETVVLADPENPPFSLIAFPVLWPTVSWDISYHVHSSVVMDSNLKEKTVAFKNVIGKDDKCSVKIVVIWQYTKPSPKIVRSPTDSLFGEASLLRFYNQELSVAADPINKDRDLDLIDEISSSIDDHIPELHYLINKSSAIFNIKNVALWSLLTKMNKIHPPQVKQWLEEFNRAIMPVV